MKCPLENGNPEILLEYCAGKLGEAQARDFALHLAACDECSRLEAAQRTVWRSLDEWQEPSISPDFNRRLYAAIEREGATQSTVVRWFRWFESRWTPVDWRPILPVGAACLTLIAAVVIGVPTPPAPTSSETQTRIEKIDLDQVEQALDDVDLLKNLGSSSGTASSAM